MYLGSDSSQLEGKFHNGRNLSPNSACTQHISIKRKKKGREI